MVDRSHKLHLTCTSTFRRQFKMHQPSVKMSDSIINIYLYRHSILISRYNFSTTRLLTRMNFFFTTKYDKATAFIVTTCYNKLRFRQYFIFRRNRVEKARTGTVMASRILTQSTNVTIAPAAAGQEHEKGEHVKGE